MSIQERLARMQEAFHGAKAQYDQRFGGVKVDEGEYQGQLSRCSLDVRKSDNALVMSVEYTILSGKFQGFTTFDQMNLDNEWGRLYAIRFVELSGYEFPDDVSTLDAVVKVIAKQAGQYLIEAKRNGDYTNIIPKQLLEGSEQVEETAPPAKEDPSPKSKVASTPKQESKASTTATKTPVKAAPKEEPVSESSDITIASLGTMDRKMLKQIITEKDIEFRVTVKHTDDDIRNAIIQGLGLVNETAAATETSSDPIPTDDELKMDLLVFCKSHRIKGVDKNMTLDEMLGVLDEYTFPKDELEEDEVKLLTMLAMEKCFA